MKTMFWSEPTFLVLNLAFDVVNRVGRLDLQSDGLAGQSLDKDLHAEGLDEMPTELLDVYGSLHGLPLF